MARRPISVSERTWLADQLDAWQAANIVSIEQRGRILDLYESVDESLDTHRSRAMSTLMGVAAFLVGLGALLLIGYNWEAMPRVLKLVIIFGAIIGTYAAAFRLRYQRGASILSEVLFLLACLFYGAGIFLIAQIFHLSGHAPDAVWWWAVGVLPIALCLDGPLLHTLLVGLLALWCGMEIIGFGDLGGWLFGRWGFVPNGAYTLPLLAAPGLAWGYRRGSVFIVGLYVALITWWVCLQPIAWDWSGYEEAIPYFIGAVGALLLVIAESHPVGSPLAVPHRLFGVLLIGGTLLVMSFYEFNREVLNRNFHFVGLVHVLAVLVLAGIVLAAAAMIRRRAEARRIAASAFTAAPLPLLDEVRLIIRRQWLPVGLIVLMAGLLLWGVLFNTPIVPTFAANVAMVALALWLIHVGLREDRGRPFAAGVLYFLLWAVVRYVDLFGDFAGMLGAAMMFFLCGATLFGVAFYWRNRRKIAHA